MRLSFSPLCIALACAFSSSALAQPHAALPQSREAAIQSALLNAQNQATQESKAMAELQDTKHVISQSRVFSVSGTDALRLGAIATKADDIRSKLIALLKLEAQKKHNISIRLVGHSSDARQSPAMKRSLTLIGDEPSLQLEVHIGGGIDLDELSAAIVQMCLYDYALKSVDAAAFERKLELPDWLVTGIAQAVLWRDGRIDRQLYQNLFDRAEMLSPDEIISYEQPWKLDATSRRIYEASCAVTILGLINQQDGATTLRSLLSHALLAEGKPREMIRRHFHTLGLDAAALNKWWALELANLATPLVTQALTPLETEERLRQALSITWYDEKTRVPRQVSLDDAYALVQVDDWRNKVRLVPQSLSHLSVRCFPSYRPLIDEYLRALQLLLDKQDPDAVQDILGPLRELREAYVITATRSRDYLDWYEITHMGHSKNTSFENYMEAMQKLRQQSEAVETHMSRYLRDIEQLHQLPYGKEIPTRIRKKNNTKDETRS